MPTVLVVDDDRDILDTVAMKLEIGGLDVHTESDGEAGLAAAFELSPDLILLDWMMPKLTGIEVCLRLRDNPQTAHVPIVLLTAKAQEPDIERGFAAGADDYLVKPFSPRELQSRVAALLARAEERS
jgi:two-component system phosphate regulon response regulator PhoB